MRDLRGPHVFAGAAAVAAALYFFTLPDGLPWGEAGHWRYTWLVASVASGFLGVLVQSHLGGRVGLAAALAWTFAPPVWDRAILGNRTILYVSIGIVVLWNLNMILLDVFSRAFDTFLSARARGLGSLSGAGFAAWRQRINHVATWAALGLALAFACVSLWRHDYRLGEAAGVYARGIVEEARGRIIVLDGVVDGQVENEVEKRGGGGGRSFATISLRNDDPRYATDVLDWVKLEWPDDEALIAAARRSVMDFLTLAQDRHPGRFYVMDGSASTADSWGVRWAQFAPYLASTDPFVPLARRHFAHEANVVANGLQERDPAAAWKLYWRILNEVQPGNVAALANLKTMAANGYPATAKEHATIDRDIAEFLSVRENREHLPEILQQAGPVRRNAEWIANLDATRRWVQRADKAADMPPEVVSMIDLNNAMVKARAVGDREACERLARQMLSNPFWRNWPAANAVMGDVTARDGDYAASEAYYRIATAGGRAPEIVWNNYSDTLRRLGRFDEAEKCARRAVESTAADQWIYRLTLAEALRDAGKNPDEVRSLVDGVLKYAPRDMHEKIRSEFGREETPEAR